MATKTISIMDDVYDRLVALKQPNESFSDELRRLTEIKGSIMEFAGAWSDISDEEAEKIEKGILAMRKGTRLQEVMKEMHNDSR
jgi:predicted CopG family antitoxin